MEYARRRMGDANLRRRPANRNFHSRALRPVIKKDHPWLWIGVLLLLVIVAATFCLFYMRNARKEHSAEAYGHDTVWEEPTRSVRTLENERWGQPKRVTGGGMQNNEAGQLFKDMGFRESTSRAMAEEFERELQRRARNSAW